MEKILYDACCTEKEMIVIDGAVHARSYYQNPEAYGFKIRSAQLEKVPYMVIVGDKDIENNTISIRSRKEGEIGAMKVQDFITAIVEEIEEKEFLGSILI